MSQATLDRRALAYKANQTRKRVRRNLRLSPPLMRIWNGNWDLRGVLASEYKANFEFVQNDSGTAVTEIPADHYLAQWIYRVDERQYKNVHITMDKDGARWGGRLKDFTVRKDANGLVTLVVRWMHDYEDLKFIQIWSNPFLPAAVQFPRVFTLAGPARWCLKLALLLNVMRLESSLWALPDDPLDPAQWFNFNQDTWPMVVKPGSLIDDLNDGILWAVPSSRWKTFHDMAKMTLEDAELMIETRRYIASDDEQPIPGQNLRNGCLVIDIVNKSGRFTATSTGGNLATGLRRTVDNFLEGFVETSSTLLTGGSTSPDYMVPGKLNTDREWPYAVYIEDETTGIETSDFTWSAATAAQVNTGGHSAPGVNEAISSSIQLVGDILGNLFQVGSIGGSADTLLAPLYTDTLLSWMSVKLPARALAAGWSHYHEFFQPGADKAYTIASLMVLRAGFWATRSQFSHQINVSDGAPYLIGENGLGHFFLGDRVGATVAGDTSGRVYVDRVTKLVLAWDRNTAPEWQITIGNNKALVDPVAKAFEQIEMIRSDMHDQGVMF